MESLLSSEILFEKKSREHRQIFDKRSIKIDFKSAISGLESEFSSTQERKGFLRMYGSSSLKTQDELSLFIYPINESHVTARTAIEFDPSTSKQSAGLVVIQNIDNWFYLKITSSDELGKVIQISKRDNQSLEYNTITPIKVEGEESISLKITLENDKLLFYYSTVKYQWHKIGKTLQATFSNDAKDENDLFFGLFVEDLTGEHHPADFKFFKYKEH